MKEEIETEAWLFGNITAADADDMRENFRVLIGETSKVAKEAFENKIFSRELSKHMTAVMTNIRDFIFETILSKESGKELSDEDIEESGGLHGIPISDEMIKAVKNFKPPKTSSTDEISNFASLWTVLIILSAEITFGKNV